MGKLNIFEITLYNVHGVYYAGQNVQGHCTIELNEEMSMRGIQLTFNGKARVDWTERNSNTDTSSSYSAEETYFNQDVLAYGSLPKQGCDTTTTLPSGRHTFPFSFILPASLPSSFESFEGKVRYTIKAVIDKPWKFNHTCLRAFTVNSILDLNTDPNALMPVQGQNQKRLCCLCCATGPITAQFRLERRGYVPGEAISLFATIHNNSDRMMDKSFVNLIMVQTFYANFSTKVCSKEVGRVTQGGVEQGQSFSWEGQQFVVPPLPPSYLNGCKIINIQYMLTLNVDPAGPALDLEVPLEIIIGTVPLSHVVERFPPHAPPPLPLAPQAGYSTYPSPGTVYPPPEGGASAPHPTPAEPSLPVMPVMPPSNIPNLPPPSYGESVFGRVNVKGKDDNEHTRGSLDFAPMYTYYDWGHRPTTSTEETKH